MGTSSKVPGYGKGREGLGWGPPLEGEKNPSPQQTSPRARQPRTRRGPSSGPPAINSIGPHAPRLHGAMPDGAIGILRESGLPLCCPHMSACISILPIGAAGSNADRAGGFERCMQALFSLPFLQLLRFPLSTPGHETFGPLLANAQTWLSSFCDLRGAGGGATAGRGK